MELIEINKILKDNEIGHYLHPENQSLIIPLQFADYCTAIKIGIEGQFIRMGSLLFGLQADNNRDLQQKLLEMNCKFGIPKLGLYSDGRIIMECAILNTLCTDERILLCIFQLQSSIEYLIRDFDVIP